MMYVFVDAFSDDKTAWILFHTGHRGKVFPLNGFAGVSSAGWRSGSSCRTRSRSTAGLLCGSEGGWWGSRTGWTSCHSGDTGKACGPCGNAHALKAPRERRNPSRSRSKGTASRLSAWARVWSAWPYKQSSCRTASSWRRFPWCGSARASSCCAPSWSSFRSMSTWRAFPLSGSSCGSASPPCTGTPYRTVCICAAALSDECVGALWELPGRRSSFRSCRCGLFPLGGSGGACWGSCCSWSPGRSESICKNSPSCQHPRHASSGASPTPTSRWTPAHTLNTGTRRSPCGCSCVLGDLPHT